MIRSAAARRGVPRKVGGEMLMIRPDRRTGGAVRAWHLAILGRGAVRPGGEGKAPSNGEICTFRNGFCVASSLISWGIGDIDGILKPRIFGRAGLASRKKRKWLLRPADGNKNSPEEPARAAVSPSSQAQKRRSHSDIVESENRLYDVWYTHMLLYSYPPPPFIKQPLSQENCWKRENGFSEKLKLQTGMLVR